MFSANRSELGRYSSDIAIDDISLESQECKDFLLFINNINYYIWIFLIKVTTPQTTTVVRTTKKGLTFDILNYPCEFDKGTCAWKTDYKEYDWFHTNGEYSTYEGYLGPASDMTSLSSNKLIMLSLNKYYS